MPKQLKEDRKRHNDLLQHSDAYVVLSESFKDELAEACALKNNTYSHKIYSINNPIIPPLQEVDSLKQKENVVLFVGQLNRQKRVDIMIDAWKSINKQYSNWKFLIVGDGPLREALENKVINEKVNMVEFCGFQQPREYYKKASIFWMTSSYEGWGMTLVEAMSEGCIPIGMDTYTSIHDIIDNEVNGYITPANDLEAFVNTTLSIIQNDSRREELAYEATRKVWQFDVERIAKQWDDLIHHVTNE